MEKRVFRILPTTGNTAVVSAGTQLYNLTTGAFNISDGQIGVFNYDTKAAVDPSSLGGVRSVFVARRVGDELIQSHRIDLKDVQSASKECFAARQPEIWKLSWERTDCNEEYQVKIQADSVEIMESLGYNFLEKTFTYKTDCCKECEGGCGDGDCSQVAENLAEVINADPDQLFTATLVAANDHSIDTDGFDFAEEITITVEVGDVTFTTVGTFADVDALANALSSLLSSNNVGGSVSVTGDVISIANSNATEISVEGDGDIDVTATLSDADGCPSILITTNFKGLTKYCGLNPDYVFPNGVSIHVTPLDKFGCVASASKLQNLEYGQGYGYDWADRAEQASGLYQSSVYRFAPLMRPDDLRFNKVDVNTNYISYIVNHHDKHEGAPSGHYFESELVTVVLIPTTAGTTETGLDALWNALFNAGVSSC